jgi:hypothetical protein
MSLILDGTNGLSDIDGSAATPAIRGTDANTGIFFPAADTIAFAEGGAESMRLDASGNLGVGTTSPNFVEAGFIGATVNGSSGSFLDFEANANHNGRIITDTNRNFGIQNPAAFAITFATNGSERARIDSSGNLLVGKTATSLSTVGCQFEAAGVGVFTVNSDNVFYINRLGNDGSLIRFYQASTEEGSISVSGTTVSYNGGHLSRWAQTTTAKDNSLVKGTVLSNLDAMNVYTDAEGNPVANEQLNKVKVSDVEGDANVAGVFVSWTHDDAHNVDEINMAMTGDMIIRIAQGVTVVRGDLLMSAGDGTAKPQGDDIVRSKTVAKVTSTHVTCTYADGSYCVPCVLMAC